MTEQEQIGTSPKKVRGMARASLALIEAMAEIAEATQPITGRGIGYKLFTMGLMPSMENKHIKKVYRLLKEARERGMIPWEWIVDETRELEKSYGFKNAHDYIRSVQHGYHRELWNDQPRLVEVWSEKGTVRGLLQPVLRPLGVGFRVMHGFASATAVHDVADGGDGRELRVLCVGDYDPSGMFMSEVDLPSRLEKYGGAHVFLERIALLQHDIEDLPSFDASDKEDDKRYRWFVKHYGSRCWERDAMDPNDLRNRVEEEIKLLLDVDAWNRGVRCAEAEKESLEAFFGKWWARGAA